MTLTFTTPLSVPVVGEILSHELPSATIVHETGRAQVLTSNTVKPADADCPCGTVKAKPGDDNASVHGWSTVSVTAKFCELPWGCEPEPSIAVRETWVVYVPGSNPAMLAAIFKVAD